MKISRNEKRATAVAKLSHERKIERIQERLRDRKDYRQTLIERAEGIDKKIQAVEAQIRELKAMMAAA